MQRKNGNNRTNDDDGGVGVGVEATHFQPTTQSIVWLNISSDEFLGQLEFDTMVSTQISIMLLTFCHFSRSFEHKPKFTWKRPEMSHGK